MNIDGTRIYYKPINAISLSVASYNGAGESSIVYLDAYGVTKQYESLLCKVDQDYTSYFALILEVGDSTGLYFYNQKDELVKVMGGAEGTIHSLNYDGTYVYVISGSGLYQIALETKIPLLIYSLASSNTYLNIINKGLYVGSFNNSEMVRINPVNKEIENILSD